MTAQSLRTRLIVIILTPLLVVSVVAGAWQFRNTTQRAEDIYDRGLFSAALAIGRDVALSDGDALSSVTRTLIGDTSGGEVFYHVYAPDGVFVTGYATPPTPPQGTPPQLDQPLYYDAVYQGRDVRVLRFQDAATADGVTGLFTVSVWQDTDRRRAFIRDVTLRTFVVIAGLVVSVALIVWFGVGVGLRPLTSLQEAIARRTPSDLTPIRRPVPVEAQGLVTTLNALLDRVSRRISSKDAFISNAAHQLRNPIAGVLALAEAVEKAPTPAAAQTRAADLVQAARDATHLTNQLLSFERAQSAGEEMPHTAVALDTLVQQTVARFEREANRGTLDITCTLGEGPFVVMGDNLMLQEAVMNLMTNALVHGGPDVSVLSLTLTRVGAEAHLSVSDDGVGVPPQAEAQIMARFNQAHPGRGSGLGLPIAVRVAETHRGRLTLVPQATGARFDLTLPLNTAGSNA